MQEELDARHPVNHLQDLGELQVLAWLGSQGDAGGTATAISGATRLPHADVVRMLERLVSRELVTCTALQPAVYRFEPSDPGVRTQLEGLLAEYRVDPLAVIRLMTSDAIERVRTAALRAFADCFRIGGPKSNG